MRKGLGGLFSNDELPGFVQEGFVDVTKQSFDVSWNLLLRHRFNLTSLLSNFCVLYASLANHLG